ncbi:MAG: N-acetyltransferase family protein [Alphaproteobacteria bacterium]
MDYQIVPLEEKHIKEFNAAVGVVAREKKYLIFIDTPTIESTKAFVKESIKQDFPHFVVIVDNKLVGWCDICLSNKGGDNHVGVLGIGLLPDFRSQGIGEKLMRKTIEKGKEKGLTRIELGVREGNERAFKLYKKLGFEIEGVARNSILIDGKYENTIKMALLF